MNTLRLAEWVLLLLRLIRDSVVVARGVWIQLQGVPRRHLSRLLRSYTL